MKLVYNWRRILLITLDVCIFIYLLIAITSWNNPEADPSVCSQVDINIADESNSGFLNSGEIKKLLKEEGIYPLGKDVHEINIREIEEKLVHMPFVNTAQCYITSDAHVVITVTQRTPIMRVKSASGDDYYVDDNGGIMPNSEYTSDMIIVTGNVTRDYACKYICILAQYIMSNEFWKNQIEQINLTSESTIELVPRVGDHIVNLGELPLESDVKKRQEIVTAFVTEQFKRLEIFYKQGLSKSGWNKYEYISLQYSNQIVCRKKGTGPAQIHALGEEPNDSTEEESAVVLPSQAETVQQNTAQQSPAANAVATPKPTTAAAKPVPEQKPSAQAQKPSTQSKPAAATQSKPAAPVKATTAKPAVKPATKPAAKPAPAKPATAKKPAATTKKS